MKTVVLFGAGQIGAMLARLMGGEYTALCFADNNESKWGSHLAGLPVLPPEEALRRRPDCCCLCVLDAERAGQMERQLRSLGFDGCEDCRFAFVSVDADLYAPTAAALPLFWERLSPGGALLIHDVNSTQFSGAGKAVWDFCEARGLLPMPVCDLHGSAVLRREYR